MLHAAANVFLLFSHITYIIFASVRGLHEPIKSPRFLFRQYIDQLHVSVTFVSNIYISNNAMARV